MAIRTIGIVVHGATGRIGATQHLKNALTPIRAEGGVAVGEDRVVPQLILVGRDKERLAAIARENGGAPWTTDLDAALSDRRYTVLFDAAATHQRQATLEKGIAAGKHIYAEKPVALTVAHGRALLAAMTASGLKHGAVEDKQYLPGLRKLRSLAQTGFFGRILGFGSNSAGGCSMASTNPASGRVGTTARLAAAASSSTCIRIFVTSSKACSGRSVACSRRRRRQCRSASMRPVHDTRSMSRIRRPR